MNSSAETMSCMYKCALSGNNKLSREVLADLQTILEHIEKKDTEGASNFALKSLEGGALAPYKNKYDKFMSALDQSGGKRRRKTRSKRTKRHNKSMRGGGFDHSPAYRGTSRTAAQKEQGETCIIFVVIFAVLVGAYHLNIIS